MSSGSQSRPLFDLTASNPTRAGLDYPKDTFVASRCSSQALRYDPCPKGALAAREAIARHYLESFQVPLDPEQVILTSSTSEGYAFALKLLADPGDSVLVPVPSYPLFEHLIALEAVRAIPYPSWFDGMWHIDLETLERRIEPRTRAIFVVNPNNPTGAFLKKPDLETLVTLSKRNNLALVSDEVFGEYALGDSPDRVATVAACNDVLSVCMSGLSKLAGLPHLKAAWMVIGGPPRVRIEAIERLEIIADAYLSVGTPVQLALPRLLEAAPVLREQIQARLRENGRTLETSMTAESGLAPLPSEGGWYRVVRAPRVRDEESIAVALLEHDGVYVHPGYFFDFPNEGHFVVSLLTLPEVLEEGIGRVVRRFENWLEA